MEITHADAAELLDRVFKAHGFTESESSSSIEEVLDAEWLNKKSHGLSIVEEMLSWNQATGSPDIRHEHTSSAFVEGNGNVGPVVSRIAMDLAIAKAKETGIGIVGARNHTPFLLTSYHPRRAAHQGLIGIAMTVAAAKVVPYGGKKAVFGTNPIAIATPGSNGFGIVADMSSTQIAAAEVRRLARYGGELPPEAALDSDGNLTRDPAAALKGAMLPFGGYKGAAIALIVEMLAGALNGAKVGVSHAGERAMLFMALDPDIFGFGDYFLQSIISLAADIHSAGDNVHVPGENYKRLLERPSIDVDNQVIQRLRELT
jgi:L-2-hydroxycarboxylate dehydrogenase (NAD+)